MLVLELHEIIRVLVAVAFPMGFNLLCVLGRELGVLKILFFFRFFCIASFSPNIWGRLGLYLC